MMKRLLTVSLMTIVGLSGCDAPDRQTLIEPDVPFPAQARRSMGEFVPLEECPECAVEPTILFRTEGKPAETSTSFDAVEGQEAELVVQVSDPKRTTVNVWLNGTKVLRPSALPQSGEDQIRVPVVLLEHNELRVRLSGVPGHWVTYWVEGGEVPDGEEPLWTDVGIVPTGSPQAPLVVADNAGMAILLLTDPESGAPRGASATLPGVDGVGLIPFDPTGKPTAAFFSGGVAYLRDWAFEGGVAPASVLVPPGGALAETSISVALPAAFGPVVEGFLNSGPTSSPGAVFATLQLQGLSGGEALAAQAGWCALEVAGVLPAGSDACRTSLIDGIPIFWAQWTEEVGYDPFLPTVTESLGIIGCAGTDCLAQAEILAFATMADVTPGKIVAVSGDGQTGTVGTALPEPVQVLITNQFDVPLPGFLADFSETSGVSRLAATSPAASIPTDAVGVSSFSWTLGSEVGQQVLAAQTIAFLPLNVGFTSTAEEASATVTFQVTSAVVGPTADMSGACTAEFGATFSVADWTDVGDAVSAGVAKDQILGTGMAMILNNGVGAFTPMFQPTQHHMISTIGPGFPDLGTIGSDMFWLTSGTSSQRVLCKGPSS